MKRGVRVGLGLTPSSSLRALEKPSQRCQQQRIRYLIGIGLLRVLLSGTIIIINIITAFSILVYLDNSMIDFEKGYLTIYVGYIEDGEIKIELPDCMSSEENEFEFGDVYEPTPIIFLINNKCSPGIYEITVKVTGKEFLEYDSYDNQLVYKDVYQRLKFPILVGSFPTLDYSPKRVFKGINEISFKIDNEKKICINGKCGIGEVKVNLEINKEKIPIEYCIEDMGLKFCKNITIQFEVMNPKYVIKKYDGNTLEISVYPPNSLVCLYPKYPVYIKENCKEAIGGLVKFELEIKDNDYKVLYLPISINNYNTTISLENPEKMEGSIKVLYLGINYTSKKVKIGILNDYNKKVYRVILKEGKRQIYLGNLNPGEMKMVGLNYKNKININIEYKFNDNIYEEKFEIEPERVIFKKEEKDLKGYEPIPIVLSIYILLGVIRWKR